MREIDPWVQITYSQQSLERYLKLLLSLQFSVRRLKEAGLLQPEEFIQLRELFKAKQRHLEEVSDSEVKTMLENSHPHALK